MRSPSPTPTPAPSLATAALCAAVLLVALPQARAINCYQCNSKVDVACAELEPPPPNGTERYLRLCKDGPDGEPAFCRRSVIKVLAANKGEGETRIVRSCGWVKHKNECYKFDDDDHHEHVCQCFSDACNAASGPGHAHFLASLLAPALALALALRR
ncbi:hypothetical protein R5R35_002578 [Gryllus longicercus]|uniref:Protein sleepless n=1 Tax=Gryllus longicercus TaxID=2509291 RepID=A0AAN9VW72_9ORTH